jgi:hypothetical protein
MAGLLHAREDLRLSSSPLPPSVWSLLFSAQARASSGAPHTDVFAGSPLLPPGAIVCWEPGVARCLFPSKRNGQRCGAPRRPGATWPDRKVKMITRRHISGDIEDFSGSPKRTSIAFHFPRDHLCHHHPHRHHVFGRSAIATHFRNH